MSTTSRATRGKPAHQDRRARETRRRRRRWLLASAVLWVPALVVGCDLTLTPSLGRDGVAEYAAGDLDEAVDTFDSMDGFNLVERWKAPFNLGTSLAARNGRWDHWAAVDALNRALRLAPEEHYCTVQRNRAIALELSADHELERSTEYAAWAEEAREVEEAGEEPPDDAPWLGLSAEDLVQDAVYWAGSAGRSYESARAARTDPACSPPSSPQEQEQEEQALDRLDDKSEQASAAAGEEPEPEPQPQTAAEREAALEERNAEAAAQAEAERQEQAAREAGSGGGDEAGEGDGEGAGGGDDGEGEGAGGGMRGW